MRFRSFNKAALLAATLVAVSFAQTAPPPDLDAWVARSMKTFEVPGISIAIVKDGKVVLAKGYGVRKLGEAALVDEHTDFGIASNSKAFTAAALAMLVDEGRISWDDPVQKALPSFQMYDPYVTREMRIRDLLCHRSGLGLGGGDLLFWPDTDVTRDQVVAALRFIRPQTSMRTRYAYNNLMFVVAGQVVAAVSGKSWDDFVRERIFAPLGMNDTRISMTSFKPGDNFATPHSRGWRLEGELRPIKGTQDVTWAAAAGIKSNAADMAKWIEMQLNHGLLDNGKRLFSEAAQREMWSPQIAIPVREASGPLAATTPNFHGYGLGWDLRDYRGHKVVSHGGALTGMVSSVTMIPDLKLGIVILTNQEETGAYSAILYHILDHYLGAPAADWIEAYHSSAMEQRARANAAEKKFEQSRAADSKPALALEKYAGEYTDAWYGKATLRLENGKLTMAMSRTPAMVGDLEHFQYDTFKVIWRDNTIPDAFVTFNIDYRGNISEMTMRPVSSLADFSFDYQDLLFRPARAAAARSAN
jgi:CubicO group peptidase (beta-lactamase class C family)